LVKVILLGLLLLDLPVEPSAQRAELQDSVGDAGLAPTGQPAPDLRSGSVTLLPDGGLALRVRFTKGSFDPVATFVQFILQLGPADSAADRCERCGHYLVDINGVGPHSRNAKVQRLVADSRYEVVATPLTQFTEAGADVTIPPSALPKDVTRIALRVVTCIRLRDDALSVIFDRMPETDQPLAVLEVGGGRRTKR
jgi:hypothetical protein